MGILINGYVEFIRMNGNSLKLSYSDGLHSSFTINNLQLTLEIGELYAMSKCISKATYWTP
jgi:hypothetical protein